MRTGRKIFAALFAFVTVLGLIGCGGPSDPSAPIPSDTTETDIANTTEDASDQPDFIDPGNGASGNDTSVEDTHEKENGSDTLVVYFSRTGEQYIVGAIDKGNTAIVAEMIAEQTGADLWEVLPADDSYPTDSYDKLTEIAKKEQDDNARPAYAGEVPDLSRYQRIIIGAPVWWGDWPMIMYTFFENNQEGLSSKILIPFSTHEGSGLSGFDSKLSSACPHSTVGEGLAIRGADTQNEPENVRNEVNEWLSGLGY